MSKLIEHVAKYCKKMSGQEMVPKTIDKQLLGQLPIIITGNYDCYEAMFTDVPILLLVTNNNDHTPLQLQKHQQIVTKLTGRYAIFVLKNVASYNISRLIDARVNFIIPEKLIFVPSLLIYLREIKDGRQLENEVMPGTAQCILLYHLQRGNLNGWTTRQLAEKFRMSYASMNRALRWLSIKGIVELIGGKEKTLMITANGKDLWEKSLPLMLSPAERYLYTDEKLDEELDAGESALEKLTMVVAPDRPCKAVSKLWAQKHKKSLNNKYGDCVVEVWRYDPALLEYKNMVDPLSLYLSLRMKDDERIQMELDHLMDKIEWLKD
ncbi:MAG: hypothetical protein VZR53_12040 [Prevotella sp.]|nr:hypothetical protein [Prevotella sp.]